MPQKKRNKVELRGYVPKDLDKLVRALANLREETLSSVLEECLEKWVNEPENIKLREKHNLDEIDS
jgi:DNA polymerase elongation subunit (family B)